MIEWQTELISWQALYITVALYSIGASCLILLDNKPAKSAIAWLLTLNLLPFIGLVFYILAGVNWKRYRILKQRPEELFSSQLQPLLHRQKTFIRQIKDEDESDIQKSIHLLLNSNHAVVTLNNRCEIFHHGSLLFADLKEKLENARQFIHMEYYIWKSDKLGQEIKDILIRKAREGVEVRLIFDGVGCFWAMTRAYKQELEEAGINYRIFLNPLTPVGGLFANYANHRKLVVIDGHFAYVGGMNLAEEYITGGDHFHYWRDTHLRLEGEAAQMLQAIFATDWVNSGGHRLSESHYFPTVEMTPHFHPDDPETLPIQIACSGPDSDWHTIKQHFFNVIINANRCVYIQSPYFIPDESIMSALEITALSGIEVHLMITGRPDRLIPYWAAETYFEAFLKAGGRLYRYRRGFLHCKTLIVDDYISSVGTCNMDIRAFELNYEVNAVIYDRDVADTLRNQFLLDLQDCEEITLARLARMPLWKRLRNGFLKILSPLL